MFVIDTNILVYAVDRNATHHGACRRLLTEVRRQHDPWFLTWGIVYEFLRVTSHPRVLRRPLATAQAWDFLQALFASPSMEFLSETERHPAIAADIFREHPRLSGNLVFDAHTAILMRENGVRSIYTKDTDFQQFRFLKVLDPAESRG